MSDKSISGYQAGEYLQFQKDVVPEVGSAYTLGTATQPFYLLNAQQITIDRLPFFASANPFSTIAATPSPEQNFFCVTVDGAFYYLTGYLNTGSNYNATTDTFDSAARRRIPFSTF